MSDVGKGHWIDKLTQKGEKVLIRNAVVCSECGAKAPIKIIKDKYGFKRIEPILTDECPRCGIKIDKRSDE